MPSLFLKFSRTIVRNYKKYSSGFIDWNQVKHCEDYLLFPQNIGANLSIYELSLSKGEIYTFVTNKNGKGKQGTLVAVIKGTLSKDIATTLMKLSTDKRLQVKEVTLDTCLSADRWQKTWRVPLKKCLPMPHW